MKPFMDQDFLLTTETAKTLFHTYAQPQPIVDYHCHIDPREIYEDRRFENITQVWLGGDHYKWRLMRANGVEERFITGDAPDREKFQKFAEALPRAIGNPLYHWCHLELKTYFGYQGVLNGDTAEEVWQLCGDKLLHDPACSARGFIRSSNVAMIGTTDDPCDSLEWHRRLAQDSSFATKVYPTFRPDKALNIQKSGFGEYMHRLGKAAGLQLNTIQQVRLALSRRMELFEAAGCRAADHGLDGCVFEQASDEALTAILQKALAGQTVTELEARQYQTALLLHCGREYAARGWAMQLHFSCLRNPNSRMFTALGPDTGYDAMAVTDSCAALARLLDALESEGELPKTILYSLNPADNAWLDTLANSFQGPELPGKVQHGSAWWFNDHKTGMTGQLTSFANVGVLGNFIGMLTDSRSFLSYTRHEYFRRILCQLLGSWAENGEYPADLETLGGLAADISYRNAKRYFNL